MKQFFIGTLLLLTAQVVVSAEDIYLDGVTLLGSKKSAYLTLNGQPITVAEGEMVGSWKVESIQSRAIVLVDNKGEKQELALHSALTPLPPPPPPVQNQPNTYQPPVIPDDQIPAGKRRVRTPFGDFLVPDEPTPNGAANPNPFAPPPAPPANTPITQFPIPADGVIPPGHRRVDTPFGSFMMKEAPNTAK